MKKSGKLTKTELRKQRFVQEYLIDFQFVPAMVRAGYSESYAKTDGYKILEDPSVSCAIRKAIDKRAKRLELNQDIVVQGLVETWQRCMVPQPAMYYDRTEKCMMQRTDPDTGLGVFSFDSSGANRALELLGKHLGMFSDKLQVQFNDISATEQAARQMLEEKLTGLEYGSPEYLAELDKLTGEGK